MTKSILLKIVTPTLTVFEGEVEHFSVPGAMGPFEVLYNHAAIVSKLVPGMLKFTQAGKPEEHYFVSGGFLELHENQGIVLADSAEHSSKISIAEVETAMESVRQRYSAHEINNDEFHHELDLLGARLAVAKHS